MKFEFHNHADIHYIKSKDTAYLITDQCEIFIDASSGIVDLTISRRSNTNIGSIAIGKSVFIESVEWLVLGHGSDTTAIMTKQPIEFVKMDDIYATSNVRAHLTHGVIRMPFIMNAIPNNMIVPHTVKLHDDMGEHARRNVKDPISILTADLFRRYRYVLPNNNLPYWLATPYDLCVPKLELMYVQNNFIKHCPIDANNKFGICPFLIIDSKFTAFNTHNISGPWENNAFYF